MEPRISLITLGVADLKRATRFYEECLRLPRLKTPPSVTFFDTDLDGFLWEVAHNPDFPHV